MKGKLKEKELEECHKGEVSMVKRKVEEDIVTEHGEDQSDGTTNDTCCQI